MANLIRSLVGALAASLALSSASWASAQEPDAPWIVRGTQVTTRIVCTISCQPFYAFDFAGKFGEAIESNLVLLDASNTVLQHATRVASSSQSWEFKHVPRGTHAIELRDPRFEPKRIEQVVPGQEYRIGLVGSASLALEVIGRDGERLHAYGLCVRYQNASFFPNEFEVRSEGTPTPAVDVITGVVPGDLSIDVLWPGGARTRQIVGPVAPGERKAVKIALAERKSLRGCVLRADGTPAANVRVEATRGAYPGHPHRGVLTYVRTRGGPIELSAYEVETRTDASGAFELTTLDPGWWTCCAVLSPYAWVADTLEHGGDAAPIVLTLPKLGEVRGRLLVPEGVDSSRLSVQLQMPDRDPVRSFLTGNREKPAPLAPDGQFRLVEVPHGATRLEVCWISHEAGGIRTSSILRRPITIGTEPLEVEIDVAPHLPKERR